MNILAISGSPRRGGNSEILLDDVIKAAAGRAAIVRKVILNELKFSGCQECGGCAKTGRCVLNDDMSPLYEQIAAANVLILTSPIFFGSLSAQLKAMIDRCQCCWTAKYILGRQWKGAAKKGYLILTSAADKRRFFQSAESIVKNLFAVLDIEFKDRLYCPGVDEQGKICQYPDCLRQAVELGRRLGK